MSIRALSPWCGWNADEIVDGFNGLLEAANKGDFSIHAVYSEKDSASNPALRHARLALYRGQPGKPLAIVAAGGGYQQVVSMIEGFPYAAELYRQGYNNDRLRQANWDAGRCERGRGLCHIYSHRSHTVLPPPAD